MRQQQAKTRILAERRALPEAEKKSESEALTFAMKIQGKYPFRCAGDPSHQPVIKVVRIRDPRAMQLFYAIARDGHPPGNWLSKDEFRDSHGD